MSDAIIETGRDAGLVRSVGFFGLLTSVINQVVGAGIFRLPAAMALLCGAYAPFAYVCCAVAMSAVAICFAEGGSRVPTSGGPYGPIEAALGPPVGFVAGVMIWLSSVLAAGGIHAAFSDAAGALVPGLASPWARAVIILVNAVIVTAVNLRSAAAASRLIAGATLIKLAPLVMLLVVGSFAVSTDNLHLGTLSSLDAFGRATVLALFAFTGMETALGTSGEVRDPARTVPRALLAGMGVIAVGYVLIQIVAQGVLGSALGTSPAPLADSLARVSPVLRSVILVGMLISMLGWLTGNAFGSPRLLFAFARDGFLPQALGKVHPKSHVPHLAIIANSVIAAALALSGTFATLAVLSTLAAAIVYFLGCVACLVLRHRNVATRGTPLQLKGTPLFAAIGMIGMVAIVAQAAISEIAGSVMAVVGSVIYYAIATRLKSLQNPAGRPT